MITNCGFVNYTDYNVAKQCGDTINMTCRVVTYTGVQSINSVRFNLIYTDRAGATTSPQSLGASLISGNYTNGIWSAAFELDTSYKDYALFKLDSVVVTDSSGGTCQASNNFDGSGCFVNFTYPSSSFYREMENQCDCYTTIVSGGCGLWNYADASSLPSGDDCGSETGYSISCDYCDPLWTPVMGSCDSSGIYLLGNSTKGYIPGLNEYPDGSFCCDSTSSTIGFLIFNHNYGSDCVAPPDEDTMAHCAKDYWLAPGGSAGTNRNDIEATTYARYDTATISHGDMRELVYGEDIVAQYQPLVYDIDGDGYTEIITSESGLSSNDYIKIFSVNETVLLQEAELVINNTGMIGIYGLAAGTDQYGEDIAYCLDEPSSLSAPPCTLDPMLVISSVSASSSPHGDGVKMYSFNGTNFVLERSYSLPGTVKVNSGSGWVCMNQYCYAHGHSNTYNVVNIQMDMTDGSTTIEQYNGAGGLPGYYMSDYTVPLVEYDDDNPSAPRVVYYYRTNNNFWEFAAYNGYSFAPLGKWYLYNVTGAFLKNKVIYVTDEGSNNLGTANVYRLVSISTVTGASNTVKIWQGIPESYSCLSNPFLTQCGYNDATMGVGVIVHAPSNTTTACVASSTSFVQDMSAVTSVDLKSVFALSNGKAYALTNLARNCYLYNDTWVEVACVNDTYSLTQTAGWRYVGSQKSTTGSMYIAYWRSNYTAYGNYTFINIYSYDATTNTYESYVNRTIPGNTSTVSTTNVVSFDCSSDSFSGDESCRVLVSRTVPAGGMWRVLPDFALETSSLFSCASGVNRVLVDSDYDVTAFCNNPYNGGIYDWNGVSWVYRGMKESSCFDAFNSNIARQAHAGGDRVIAFVDVGSCTGNSWYFNTTTSLFAAMYPASFREVTEVDGDIYVTQNGGLGIGTSSYIVGIRQSGKYPDYDEVLFNSSSIALRSFDYDNEEDTGGWAVGDDGYIFQYGDICTTYSNTTTPSSALKCYSTSLALRKSIPLSDVCHEENPVTSVDQGSYDEVFAGSGAMSMRGGGTFYSDIVMSSTAIAVPADVNSDMYPDVIVMDHDILKVYLSIPPATTYEEGFEPEILRLQPCVASSNGAAMVRIQGRSFDPEQTFYSINWGEGTTQVDVQNYPDFEFTHTYSTSGEYTVVAKLCDQSIGECDNETCFIPVNLSSEIVSECNIGDDGTFNWDSDIGFHGWTGTSKYPVSGYLKFNYELARTIRHPTDCDSKVFNIELSAKVGPSSELILAYDTGEVGYGIHIALLRISNGALSVTQDTANYVEIANITNDLETYRMVIDSGNQEYSIYREVDGVFMKIYTGTIYSMTTSFSPSYLSLQYVRGVVDVDYVSTWGSGVIAVPPAIPPSIPVFKDKCPAGDYESLLAECSESNLVDLAYYEGSKDNASLQEIAYPDVGEFCSSCGNNFCDFEVLRAIMKYSSSCSRQVMNYCMSVTYYADESTGGSASGGSSSTEGALMCSTNLMTSMVAEKMALPIIGSMWQVVKANLWAVILMVMFIIVVFAVMSKNR
jgi:hypothetical protein